MRGLKALDMIDAIINAIRASESRGEARDRLMAGPFEFSDVQAEHILDMQLSRLTRLGQADLEEEMAKLRQTMAELEAILGDQAMLNGVVKTELGEIKARLARLKPLSSRWTWRHGARGSHRRR